jgi:hypothetical protein
MFEQYQKPIRLIKSSKIKEITVLSKMIFGIATASHFASGSDNCHRVGFELVDKTPTTFDKLIRANQCITGD